MYQKVLKSSYFHTFKNELKFWDVTHWLVRAFVNRWLVAILADNSWRMTGGTYNFFAACQHHGNWGSGGGRRQTNHQLWLESSRSWGLDTWLLRSWCSEWLSLSELQKYRTCEAVKEQGSEGGRQCANRVVRHFLGPRCKIPNDMTALRSLRDICFVISTSVLRNRDMWPLICIHVRYLLTIIIHNNSDDLH